MSTPRPKARWKVAYDAEVAAMDNATLLETAMSERSLADSEYGDNDDLYRSRACASELTRRLTACGFLPPAPGANAP